MGTNEGLVRFDGYDFVTYSRADGSLSNNAVTALVAGRNGELWIGTLDGLTRYANGQFTQFTVKDGLPAKSINSLVEDDDGVVWMASGGLLTRFENGKFTTFPLAKVAPIASVQVVYEDPEKQLWVAGAGGVVKRTGHTFAPVLGRQELDDYFINAILRTKVGLWVAAGDKGILLLKSDGSRRRFDLRDGLPNNLVRALCEDRAGNFWAGTNSVS